MNVGEVVESAIYLTEIQDRKIVLNYLKVNGRRIEAPPIPSGIINSNYKIRKEIVEITNGRIVKNIIIIDEKTFDKKKIIPKVPPLPLVSDAPDEKTKAPPLQLVSDILVEKTKAPLTQLVSEVPAEFLTEIVVEDESKWAKVARIAGLVGLAAFVLLAALLMPPVGILLGGSLVIAQACLGGLGAIALITALSLQIISSLGRRPHS